MTIRAVLFDVDGTLYHQARLRAAMGAELGWAGLRTSRTNGRATLRVLRTFRRVREELRDSRMEGPLECLQYSVTAERTAIPEDIVRAVVAEWIFTRPLKYLPMAARSGVRPALEHLIALGIHVGAFSDYPTEQKVEALGLSDLFSLHRCATDAGVNAFKPHPAGFLSACEHWALSPAQVLYVGDRPDVDAVGADAAGLPCVVIGRSLLARPSLVRSLRRFRDLPQVVAGMPATERPSASTLAGDPS